MQNEPGGSPIFYQKLMLDWIDHEINEHLLEKQACAHVVCLYSIGRSSQGDILGTVRDAFSTVDPPLVRELLDRNRAVLFELTEEGTQQAFGLVCDLSEVCRSTIQAAICGERMKMKKKLLGRRGA
ncbi:MAG TPA: hypothetical protein VJI96_04415 [Candidatus Andersenbacteria bacterium]|nr:hypothetical protein [Candidatus Andersenbacteria bacterium]